MKISKQWILNYLGKRLESFRNERELSRKEAANKIGIAPRTLAGYERGEREITLVNAEKLAEIYGVTFEELIDYKYIRTKIENLLKPGENPC